MVRKNDKWRPYNVDEAIRRAVLCRTLRERVGLSRLEFARLAQVTERSAGRWEDCNGGGNCPDDVLQLLENELEKQRAAVARAVARAYAMTGATGGAADHEAAGGGAMQSRQPADRGQGGGDAADIRPVKGASIPMGGAHATASPAVKGASMPNARERARDVKGASMPIRLLYYPHQRSYDVTHAEHAYYGVANATARACAQELERLGFEIEWKYADESDAYEDNILE